MWLTLENVWLWWLAGAWSYPGLLPGQVYQQSQIWADGIRQKLIGRTEKNGRWQGMKINTEASYNSVQYALSTVSLAPPVNKGFFESPPTPPTPLCNKIYEQNLILLKRYPQPPPLITFTYTHTHICILVNTTDRFTYTCICTHTYAHMYVCTHIHAYTHVLCSDGLKKRKIHVLNLVTSGGGGGGGAFLFLIGYDRMQ